MFYQSNARALSVTHAPIKLKHVVKGVEPVSVDFLVAPLREARVAGAAYFMIIAGGLFVELAVRSSLTVSNDAAATAANILGAEHLYRIGFVAELFVLVCDVVVAVLLYRVLRPCGEVIALLAASFRLVMAAMLGVNTLNHFEPLLLLSGDAAGISLPAAQLEALALESLRLQAVGYSAGLVFFGLACLFAGMSIARSTFLPRAIGWLMMIAGICYLVNSLSGFLAPDLARALFPYILLPCLIAELSLSLWLLVLGVNGVHWLKQADVRLQ